MKKYFFTLATLLFMGVFVLSNQHSASATQLKDGDFVPIILTPTTGTPGGAPRTQGVSTVTAAYDAEDCQIEIRLTNIRDEVSIVIENVVTSEYDSYELEGNTSYLIPFSGTAGCWVITIALENGDEYYGCFIL